MGPGCWGRYSYLLLLNLILLLLRLLLHHPVRPNGSGYGAANASGPFAVSSQSLVSDSSLSMSLRSVSQIDREEERRCLAIAIYEGPFQDENKDFWAAMGAAEATPSAATRGSPQKPDGTMARGC